MRRPDLRRFLRHGTTGVSGSASSGVRPNHVRCVNQSNPANWLDRIPWRTRPHEATSRSNLRRHFPLYDDTRRRCVGDAGAVSGIAPSSITRS